MLTSGVQGVAGPRGRALVFYCVGRYGRLLLLRARSMELKVWLVVHLDVERVLDGSMWEEMMRSIADAMHCAASLRTHDARACVTCTEVRERGFFFK
jgi:hypothetical protein